MFAVVVLVLPIIGCGSADETTVIDPNQMNAEQQAMQDAYVQEMDGPPPN
jgi:hypothetical protein